jgi:enterochelin esterase-like enzyme
MTRLLFTACIWLASLAAISAQPPGGPRPPQFASPEVSAERKVTLRVHAPKAEAVRLSSSDMPGIERGGAMKKGENGVWETTVGPLPAGAYRYTFNVDGLSVIDPRNPATSEANSNTFSLVVVPGSDLFDTKEVPHGAVAQVTYYSNTLKRHRRMHVYTPPGYEKGDTKYPVFFLLHGAGDCDASWSTVGRAGFILDNLIAAGKAKPMIVAMPAGHTGQFSFGGRGGDFNRQIDEFGTDFTNDLKPYVEKTYRVLDGRVNRAIAGLSMGGMQTLNVAFGNLKDYGHVGVYSSGIFGIAGGGPGGGQPNTQWQDKHKETLDDAELKKGLKTLYIACGKDDFLVGTSDATIKMLKDHKFEVIDKKTDGGHTWLNWRDYLADFAPMLFQDK